MGSWFGPLVGCSVPALYNIRDVFYITMFILLMNAALIASNKKLGKVPKTAKSRFCLEQMKLEH